jgi:glycolate oxidase iron-sulfur subunit
MARNCWWTRQGRSGRRRPGESDPAGPQESATGNIGCAMQIGARTAIPVLHTVELLDWATGGPMPALLHNRAQ